MDVILRTPNGEQHVSTDGVKTAPKLVTTLTSRRVTLADLDGPVGAFLAEVLCEIAPLAFQPNNWKGKLATFVTSRTSSFLCCGRAVGLAHMEQDTMSGAKRVEIKFCIVADGGSEQDGYEVIKAVRQWARDLDNMPIVMPPPEYCNMAPGKLANFFKAEKKEQWVIPALMKK